MFLTIHLSLLLFIISIQFSFSQIITGQPQGSFQGPMIHMNPMMARFQYHGNRSDLLRRPTNMKCITSSEEDRRDCDEDWFDRLKDDLNDREECCAYVEYRGCIKDAFEDEDSCSEEDVEVQYELWRNATDAHYPLLTRRCWDDSADSMECMFLNNMALWICLLTFMIILMVLLCAAFFYLLLVKGNFV